MTTGIGFFELPMKEVSSKASDDTSDNASMLVNLEKKPKQSSSMMKTTKANQKFC